MEEIPDEVVSRSDPQGKLGERVSFLGLPGGVYPRLKRNGILTCADLVQLSSDALESQFKLTSDEVASVREKLGRIGLALLGETARQASSSFAANPLPSNATQLFDSLELCAKRLSTAMAEIDDLIIEDLEIKSVSTTHQQLASAQSRVDETFSVLSALSAGISEQANELIERENRLGELTAKLSGFHAETQMSLDQLRALLSHTVNEMRSLTETRADLADTREALDIDRADLEEEEQTLEQRSLQLADSERELGLRREELEALATDLEIEKTRLIERAEELNSLEIDLNEAETSSKSEQSVSTKPSILEWVEDVTGMDFDGSEEQIDELLQSLKEYILHESSNGSGIGPDLSTSISFLPMTLSAGQKLRRIKIKTYEDLVSRSQEQIQHEAGLTDAETDRLLESMQRQKLRFESSGIHATKTDPQMLAENESARKSSDDPHDQEGKSPVRHDSLADRGTTGTLAPKNTVADEKQKARLSAKDSKSQPGREMRTSGSIKVSRFRLID